MNAKRYNKAPGPAIGAVVTWIIAEVAKANDIVIPDEILLAMAGAISTIAVYILPKNSE